MRNLSSLINFGPAHPAAHGVFRLILEISGEIILSTTHVQGLLFRASELLMEFRNPELVAGYFARLDYVSYFCIEISVGNFSAHASANISSNWNLNYVSNALLNCACTLADSGMVGIILWTFEAREIIAQQFLSLIHI